jgi:hypothetical protein
MIINGKSTSSSNAGKTYIVPGDPDNSLIYRRAAIVQDMPPGSTDVRNPTTGLTVSDFSVLREWILNCTGATGAGGAGGATGSGGSTGAGGSSGAGGGGATDAGTGATGAGGATSDAGGGAAGAGGAAGSGGRRDNARYSFESSAQGWAGLTGAGIGTFTGVATSAAEVFAGQRALAGTIASTAATDYFLEVENPAAVTPGASITFHVFIPTTAAIGIASVQPYVVDAANTFTGSFFSNPTMGQWVTLTVVVPASAATITRLGVQLHTAGAFDGTVYVDSVNY